jgi:hypothetical protein
MDKIMSSPGHLALGIKGTKVLRHHTGEKSIVEGMHRGRMIAPDHLFGSKRRTKHVLPSILAVAVSISLLLPATCVLRQVSFDLRHQPTLHAVSGGIVNGPYAAVWMHPKRTPFVLGILRGGSQFVEQGREHGGVNPLTPVAPAALALQEELGRVTKEWVEDWERGAEPPRDLQYDIDAVIEKWTKTAIATPRTIQKSARAASMITDNHSPRTPASGVCVCVCVMMCVRMCVREIEIDR